MSKKRKAGPVKVTYANGHTELVKASRFKKKPKKKKQTAYAAYRRSSHWRDIRRQALERDGHCCTTCKGTVKLEVHHRTYERVGKELLEDVIVLCQRCHAVEHQWLARERRARAS